MALTTWQAPQGRVTTTGGLESGSCILPARPVGGTGAAALTVAEIFMIRPSTVAALFVLLVALPAAAAPKSPKVALTAIDGDGGGEVRDAVAEALDGNDLTLIGEKETNRAADK